MRLQVTLGSEDLGIFDPDELTMDQAMLLEDQTGYAIIELGQQLQRGSARALQALVWLQRVHHRIGVPNLHENFKLGDLKLDDADPKDPDPVKTVPIEDLERLFETDVTDTSGS